MEKREEGKMDEARRKTYAELMESIKNFHDLHEEWHFLSTLIDDEFNYLDSIYESLEDGQEYKDSEELIEKLQDDIDLIMWILEN